MYSGISDMGSKKREGEGGAAGGAATPGDEMGRKMNI